MHVPERACGRVRAVRCTHAHDRTQAHHPNPALDSLGIFSKQTSGVSSVCVRVVCACGPCACGPCACGVCVRYVHLWCARDCVVIRRGGA